MDPSFIIELVGYVGSALVILSMLMTSLVKLRVINTVGCVVSITYSLIIGSYPVAIMNICLVFINAWNLIRLFRPNKHFDLIECKVVDDSFLAYFLKRWKDDIRLHFPEFDRKAFNADTAFLVCCNGEPAGVLLGSVDNGVMDIALDYTTPAYRDCSVAKFYHSKLPEKSIHTLLSSQSKTRQHVWYLDKMGFQEKDGVYVKKLTQD